MRILVAGGGIGGLTAALALTRTGHDVTVAERAPRSGPAGAGIVLAPNALHVLAALGVDPAPHSLPLPSLDVAAADGTVLRRLAPQDLAGGYGHIRALSRAALHTALLEALPPDARPVYGRAVASLRDTGASVTVRFEGDPPAAPGEVYDLVVGADGIRSTVRAHAAARPPPSATAARPAGAAWPTTRARPGRSSPGAPAPPAGSYRCPAAGCTTTSSAPPRAGRPRPRGRTGSAASSPTTGAPRPASSTR
ncbi:FAD-dependent monooxygenase [Streptomyces somaliensis]|nr:FAD-dependent monooxygenase [Streptomyces somaliensis]